MARKVFLSKDSATEKELNSLFLKAKSFNPSLTREQFDEKRKEASSKQIDSIAGCEFIGGVVVKMEPGERAVLEENFKLG